MKTIVIEVPLQEVMNCQGDYVIRLRIQQNETPTQGKGVLEFMEEVISRLKKDGKTRTSETYRATKLSFSKFLKQKDLPMTMLTTQVATAYEAWLQQQGLTMNSTSFYMRILRAVYNRAVEEQGITDVHPFQRVYTGIAKTEKRAFDIDLIRRIESADIGEERMRFARDLFMFSFYTRGMSFVDMAYLKIDDVKGNRLVYNRRKTGQKITLEWDARMQKIVNRLPSATGHYLLPIIRHLNGKERGQYRHCQRYVNEQLHLLSDYLGLPHPLTMYVARHSWASIAHGAKVPVEVISQGMGHNSEKTTRIYLKELDYSIVDEANRQVMELLDSQ